MAGCAPAGRTVQALAENGADHEAPATGVAATEKEFSIDGGRIRGTLTIPPGAGVDSRRAVVINPVTYPAALLARGIVVARYHLQWPTLPPPPTAVPEPGATAGKPVGVWLLASPRPGIIGQSYFQLIWAEGIAAKAVTEYLAGLDFVDSERIGMAGISTNGFKVYSALLSGVPLRAAVIVGACADYHVFLRDSPVALGGGALQLDPDYETWLSAREPIGHADRLAPTAVLLVNGGRDHVIPAACVERSAAVLRAAYEQRGLAERFRLSWWPEATHSDLIDSAATEIAAWWEKWLGTPET